MVSNFENSHGTFPFSQFFLISGFLVYQCKPPCILTRKIHEMFELIALLCHVVVINRLENILMFGLFLGQDFKYFNKLRFIRRLFSQFAI